MDHVTVTAVEAVALARLFDISVDEVGTLPGVTLIAGAANADAAKAVKPAPVKASQELMDAAELLYNTGRKARATKDGRTKRLVGDIEGLAPYRVMVTKAKQG